MTYNNGHVLDEDGGLRPRECWLLAIPGRVFALLREAGITRRDKTYLWGHSAGGQFVHRLLATQPAEIFEAVGAANSGWYTLPTLDLHYPDGLSRPPANGRWNGLFAWDKGCGGQACQENRS